MSRNLVKQYENEQFLAEIDEKAAKREENEKFEFEAEYGDYDDYIPEGFYMGSCEGPGEYLLCYNGNEVGSMDYKENIIMVQAHLFNKAVEFYGVDCDWTIMPI